MLGAATLAIANGGYPLQKTIISGNTSHPSDLETWLDLEAIAAVEVTSEDNGFPIESVFSGAKPTGWRAATTGPQVIRLHFNTPQPIRRIQLHIVEKLAERSQEFLLKALTSGEWREIARQQWNFSPNGTTEEIEDYRVQLDEVTVIELRIDPDRSHNPALSQHVATIERLQVA
jgi:hypothetical protein